MVAKVLSVSALLWSLFAIGSLSWAIANDRYTQPVAPGLIALENIEHRLTERRDNSAGITLSRAEALAAVQYAEKEMVARDRSAYAHLGTSVVLGLLAAAFLLHRQSEPHRDGSDSHASRAVVESPSN